MFDFNLKFQIGVTPGEALGSQHGRGPVRAAELAGAAGAAAGAAGQLGRYTYLKIKIKIKHLQ